MKVYATDNEVRLIGRFLSDDLTEGSADELKARRALARLLRNPAQELDMGTRWVLADLFDPDRPLAYSREGPIRLGKADETPWIFQLKHRRRGRPAKEAAAEKEIAEFIWHRHGKRQKDIVQAATKKFGPKRTRILEIWKHWQQTLKREFQTAAKSNKQNGKAKLPEIVATAPTGKRELARRAKGLKIFGNRIEQIFNLCDHFCPDAEVPDGLSKDQKAAALRDLIETISVLSEFRQRIAEAQ